MLAECAVCIDRMQAIESKINSDEKMLTNSSLSAVKDRYAKNFQRYCNELCLSPQSRAKIANINLKSREENPLLELLNDDD